MIGQKQPVSVLSCAKEQTERRKWIKWKRVAKKQHFFKRQTGSMETLDAGENADGNKQRPTVMSCFNSSKAWPGFMFVTCDNVLGNSAHIKIILLSSQNHNINLSWISGSGATNHKTVRIILWILGQGSDNFSDQWMFYFCNISNLEFNFQFY